MKFNPNDQIVIADPKIKDAPVITVQEEVDGYYILVNPEGRKFLRPVDNVDETFVPWSPEAVIGVVTGPGEF